MKNIIILFVISCTLYSCTSSKKYFARGEYDLAVQRSIFKLRKKPTKTEELAILDKAYPLAQKKEMDRVNFLKLENNPQNWDEIYRLLNSLKYRQDLVKTVIPLVPAGSIKFSEVNYDEEIIQSKMKAAESYYQAGRKQMDDNKVQSYRNAYYNFQKAKEYNAEYGDIDQLINDCKEKGTSHALITVENNSIFKLDNEFYDNLLSFGVGNLNQDWVEYYKTADKDKSFYSHTIYIRLRKIEVSPEKLSEKEYTETKKVADGWEYEYDAKGNVKKDSTGKDIKRPKYKTISCTINQKSQLKSCVIEGVIDFVDNNSNQSVSTRPISAGNVFENNYATANGDVNALSDEKSKMLKRQPLPFPPDMEMIKQAGSDLKSRVYQEIRNNKNAIK